MLVVSVACAVFVTGTLIVAGTAFACLYAAANAAPLTVPPEEWEDRGDGYVAAPTEALAQADDFWQILLGAEREGPHYEDAILAERSWDGKEY